MTDIGPHGSIAATAAEAGERTIRFVLVLNKRPVPSVNLTTLKGYMRLSFLERDGTQTDAAPTNTPTETDATDCPGEYALELTAAEVTHTALMLHINDGDGNTFDYQYINLEQYGGTDNTGGKHNR